MGVLENAKKVVAFYYRFFARLSQAKQLAQSTFMNQKSLPIMKQLTKDYPNIVAQVDTINFNIPLLEQSADLIEQLNVVNEQKLDDFRPDKIRQQIEQCTSGVLSQIIQAMYVILVERFVSQMANDIKQVVGQLPKASDNSQQMYLPSIEHFTNYIQVGTQKLLRAINQLELAMQKNPLFGQ